MTTPVKRPPPDRDQGRKSLQGSGKSPVLQISVNPAQRDKLKRLGGADWIRSSIDRAREPLPVNCVAGGHVDC